MCHSMLFFDARQFCNQTAPLRDVYRVKNLLHLSNPTKFPALSCAVVVPGSTSFVSSTWYALRQSSRHKPLSFMPGYCRVCRICVSSGFAFDIRHSEFTSTAFITTLYCHLVPPLCPQTPIIMPCPGRMRCRPASFTPCWTHSCPGRSLLDVGTVWLCDGAVISGFRLPSIVGPNRWNFLLCDIQTDYSHHSDEDRQL